MLVGALVGVEVVAAGAGAGAVSASNEDSMSSDTPFRTWSRKSTVDLSNLDVDDAEHLVLEDDCDVEVVLVREDEELLEC